MLFNSYLFVFLFLPFVWIVFQFFQRFGTPSQIAWLTAASFVFYAVWDWRFVGLLGGSLLVNFVIGFYLARENAREPGSRFARYALAGGVAANLLVLACFKYYGFFAENLNAIPGINLPNLNVILPLGLSFYTFTQIAFLVDASRGEAREYRLMNYALFVTYFPHLIAGPVLHHKQMMPQFARPFDPRRRADDLALGLTIFVIGLSKKVLMADMIAGDADRVFSSDTSSLTFIEAWAGAIAYSLQLYFDFSGYSDMAVGISKMFGIDLPLNFNSPYKAPNIIEFWRRWHMTLSRFLRDYLYVPLGGNRKGPARRHVNIMATMLLGGLWHGAGWTFVIWGGLHGLYLVVNHAWQSLRQRLGIVYSARWTRFLAVAITFVAVTIAWVFFRAESLTSAIDILRAMAALNGVPLPYQWIEKWGVAGEWLTAAGVPSANLEHFRGGRQLGLAGTFLFIAWLLPNTQEITGYLVRQRSAVAMKAILWRPSPVWAAVYASMALACLYNMGGSTRFLYFQF